jgi:nucleoside-triphosphatase THEP1
MDLDAFESDLQAYFPDSASGMGNILVISGGRGIGKSSFLYRRIECYRQSSRLARSARSPRSACSVAGLLTPGRFEDGIKTGYSVIDLATDESRLLASTRAGEVRGMHFGHWNFDADVFAWGNQCLERFSGADVLVVDELGFLEFDLKTGWMASFEALKKQQYRLALVVIRPECIEPFAKLGFHFQVKEIDRPDASNSSL